MLPVAAAAAAVQLLLPLQLTQMLSTSPMQWHSQWLRLINGQRLPSIVSHHAASCVFVFVFVSVLQALSLHSL
jgi:hypothetical protein